MNSSSIFVYIHLYFCNISYLLVIYHYDAFDDSVKARHVRHHLNFVPCCQHVTHGEGCLSAGSFLEPRCQSNEEQLPLKWIWCWVLRKEVTKNGSPFDMRSILDVTLMLFSQNKGVGWDFVSLAVLNCYFITESSITQMNRVMIDMSYKFKKQS